MNEVMKEMVNKCYKGLHLLAELGYHHWSPR
jgi:hypothetical protein